MPLHRGPLEDLQLRPPSEATRRLTIEAFAKLDFRRHQERLDVVWQSIAAAATPEAPGLHPAVKPASQWLQHA